MSPAGPDPDHSFDAVARRLYAAWSGGPREAAHVRAELPVPGPVALRARFHFLTDGATLPANIPPLPIDEWLEHLRLETEGDAALIANDIAAAVRAFSSLLTPGETTAGRIARVHALIGLGDAARQSDEIEQALTRYEEALVEAGELNHRFGEVRALVPLAYVALNSASAREAHDLFRRAEEISRALDERLYLANALIGAGEASARLRENDEARRMLREALQIAKELRSDVAIGNAAQRLADLELRVGERERVGDLLAQAADAYERAGAVIGAATAADSLADQFLARNDIHAAATQYERALQLSEDGGYRRGQAHALTGLARCAENRAELEMAAALHNKALAIYESVDDLIGRTSARSGLARVAAARGDHVTAIDHWLTVIDGIEEMRMARDRVDLQEEYRRRFSAGYSAALKAAVYANDREAFVTVFENLAGRRLAGLLERAARSGDTELLSQLVARSDHQAFRAPRPAEPTREERLRRISAAVIRFGLSDRASNTFDEAVAGAYRPLRRNESAELLAALPDAETLLIAPIPDDKNRVVWLSQTADGDGTLGFTELEPAASGLLDRLAGGGWADELRIGDLEPLSGLIPDAVRERLSKGDRPLILVPLDRLWSVPWSALPLTADRVLGEVAPLVLSPSLSVHAALTAEPAATAKTPRPVVFWRSPAIVHHELDLVFVDDPAWQQQPPTTGPQLREALLRNATDDPLVVIACHGYPLAGLGHYLELAPGEPLTPADILNAQRTPSEVVLISCWGAITPEASAAESLTVATLTLTRGSLRVAASIAELGDSRLATLFVQGFLHRLRDRPMAVALRDATARFLDQPGHRDGPLRDWSPLVIVGSL